MKEFAIEIVETLSRVVYVDAENKDDALSQVWDMYSEEEIVLDASDHIDTDLTIYEE